MIKHTLPIPICQFTTQVQTLPTAGIWNTQSRHDCHLHTKLNSISFQTTIMYFFNTCTVHPLLFFIITNQCTISIITVCTTAVFPCLIYSATCFGVLCHQQTVTHLLLAKLHKRLDCSCLILQCETITMLQYVTAIRNNILSLLNLLNFSILGGYRL
jgi:hypothetical protein